MFKTLALGVVALNLFATVPALAQTTPDSAKQSAAEAGGSPGTVAGPARPGQTTSSDTGSQSRNVYTRDTIGNQPPHDQTEAGGGAR
jgi:hypothetical protein